MTGRPKGRDEHEGGTMTDVTSIEQDRTKCDRCNGIGRIEVHASCQVEPWASLYRNETNEADENGFKRVRCADCGGLGYR